VANVSEHMVIHVCLGWNMLGIEAGQVRRIRVEGSVPTIMAERLASIDLHILIIQDIES
jgi:hypothetical protein